MWELYFTKRFSWIYFFYLFYNCSWSLESNRESNLVSALIVRPPLILRILMLIFSRDSHRLLQAKKYHFPFRHTVQSVEEYGVMPGGMRKISTRESVMRQERVLFLFSHPMRHVQSMRVRIGTPIDGMRGNMEEILIFHAHFLSNGMSSRKLYQCHEKQYLKQWRILSTRIIVVI